MLLRPAPKSIECMMNFASTFYSARDLALDTCSGSPKTIKPYSELFERRRLLKCEKYLQCVQDALQY